MNIYTDYKLVEECLVQIEKKLDWGTSKNWHNEVFNELSDIIQKETKTLLSSTTLKRVWGKVDYKNAPSISTLNTLAQFAGYSNWREFKLKNNNKKPSWIQEKINPNLRVIAISSILIAISLISLFSMISLKNNTNHIDLSKIEFTSRPISKGIPNSVVFDFELNKIKSDSIYIQQFWDETKTIKLNLNQKQATGIYYYPGFYRAKLIIDGKILKENDLFLKSDGWLATIDYEPIPKYIREIKNLQLPENNLNEIINNKQPVTSTYHYIDDFDEISGDNFRLNSKLKNTYNDKWAVCQNTTIIIIGTKSALLIPFAKSGCSSNIDIMMSDIYLDGKKHNLSSLTLDLTKETAIKIEVINKQLSVFTNNKKVFTGSYNESIGRIVGLRYKFLGAGEVNKIKLSNLSESKVIIDKR